MSEQSWKEEFYFIDAEELAKDQYSDLDRLEHAKLKWTGFKNENLGKHNINVLSISFESETCALCCRYLCSACVVKKVIGDTCVALYDHAIKHDRPEVMLELIEKVKDGIK